MKKPKIAKESECPEIDEETESSFESITRGLDIPNRTICPPSEELIEQLNKMASRPPFSIIYKGKDQSIR
jgi:hypothetical protein